jgi:hypothetical protein
MVVVNVAGERLMPTVFKWKYKLEALATESVALS